MATGHLRKRVNSKGIVSYQIVIECEPDLTTGHRNRRYETFHGTKKQAEARMRELIAQADGGGVTKQSTTKLSDWLDQYITNYKPNIEETTKASYEEKVKNCVDPYIGKRQLKELNADIMQGWVNDLSKGGASPKTIRNAYNVVNAALKKAVVTRMISHNPCEGVELPKLEHPKTKVYTADQIKEALKLAEGTDMHLILLLFATTGLRRGELCALKWEHIDLDSGVLHVEENTVLVNGKRLTKSPKTAAGRRDISIGHEVTEALKQARTQYKSDKLRQGAAFHDNGYVIHTQSGDQYRPDSLTQKWERFLEKNDLPHIRLHDLRHSHATALIQAGVSPKVVQQRLGHSDVTTTLNIYTHVTQAMDKEAADKVDALLLGKASGQ